MARPKMKLKLKKGALHKALGISQNKTIPASKEAIHQGDSPHLKKMKQMAINMRGWNKGGHK